MVHPYLPWDGSAVLRGPYWISTVRTKIFTLLAIFTANTWSYLLPGMALRNITGDHITYLVGPNGCNQKQIYFAIFSNNIRSYLLLSYVILRGTYE